MATDRQKEKIGMYLYDILLNNLSMARRFIDAPDDMTDEQITEYLLAKLRERDGSKSDN